ncbi:hypothetical protein [Rubrivirga sp.]|uniref:hypothetical protein n=1 Tax=Rubrivirga sp. TaxID=1885344 RepID=UPI003C77E43C
MTRLFVAFVLVAGCAGSGDLEVVQGIPFGLEVGEVALADGHEVRFLEVVEDSRCPDGAECVWAGKARVRVAVDGAPAVLSVPHTDADGPEPATAVVGAVEVGVQSLTPYPAVEAPDGPVVLTLIAMSVE